jgi:hypothetical protein
VLDVVLAAAATPRRRRIPRLPAAMARHPMRRSASVIAATMTKAVAMP